ncbi:MAG TPA: hypothetical protein ENK80_04530 [Rhodobacterales bacterium]|nr:hypothetical protein [Rhodobacterales bacterium]
MVRSGTYNSDTLPRQMEQPLTEERPLRRSALAQTAPNTLTGPLAQRFDREIAARDVAARQIAAHEETQSDNAPGQPLVHRSATHAINAAILAFALPVGAALITLVVMGRESLALSSRAMAMTEAGIGLAQNETVAQLLAWMV